MGKKLIGDDFQFIVATHLNTDNVHNHIVINSVSFKSGNKFYSNRKTKDFIRITSDFICRENRLRVIKTPWKNKGYYKLYVKNNPYMQLVKKDIDDAIAISNSYKGFVSKLESKGYYVSENENTGLIISRDNSYKIVRPQELFGNNYTKEKIKYRIENKVYNQVYIPKKKYKTSIEEYNKFKQKQREHQLRELPALYILICLLLRIDQLPRKIEFNNYRVPIIKEMKISLKHLESLSQQAILLSKNKINNLEELKSFRYNLEEKVRILKGKRENLWRKRSKETNPEIKEKLTHEIGDLRALIKKTNKDIVNCYEIENRTILLQKQLELEKSKENVKDKKKDKKKIREIIFDFLC
ncbi:MAG: relaxase/mobilization nuclease domain-containing protein [Clostridia bacterium]|nr:relaxase/mobilization nuclease domain-containing protein [Clostridia bacterium]